MVPAFTAAMLAITSLMPPLIITRSSPVKVLLARKLSICSFTVSVVLLPAASGFGHDAGVASGVALAASRRGGEGLAIARSHLQCPVVDRAVVDGVARALWPTSLMPSPKAIMRCGEMADSVVLEPQTASSAADAQAATIKLRRIQFAAMYFSKKWG